MTDLNVCFLFIVVTVDRPHVFLPDIARLYGELWCRLPCQHVPGCFSQLECTCQCIILHILSDVWRALLG